MDRDLLSNQKPETPNLQAATGQARNQNRLFSILRHLVSVIRYRFLLFAGILAFILGNVVAMYVTDRFYISYFLLGFAGLIAVLIGIETFNEYFDSKMGGDRIFSDTYRKVSIGVFKIGIFSFTIAFFIALYLALMRGCPIIIFALLGFLAAAFYVAPPIRWSYRGLGEVVIFLAYGPLMVTGSYYLQTQRIDLYPMFISLIPGLLILAIALANSIPDFYQDRIVGKRNIVVRIGKEKTIFLYTITLLCFYLFSSLGLWWEKIPFIFVLIFLSSPFALRSMRIAKKYYNYPNEFIPVIQGTISLYTLSMFLLIVSYLV